MLSMQNCCILCLAAISNDSRISTRKGGPCGNEPSNILLELRQLAEPCSNILLEPRQLAEPCSNILLEPRQLAEPCSNILLEPQIKKLLLIIDFKKKKNLKRKRCGNSLLLGSKRIPRGSVRVLLTTQVRTGYCWAQCRMRHGPPPSSFAAKRIINKSESLS